MSQLQAAETEIKDLQSEFELERIDYLSTIRRLERDLMLFQQLLDQVQSLVRRDCNYSNLEKIKRESVWDEETSCWKIPQPLIQKTRLPAGKRSVSTVPPACGCFWAQQITFGLCSLLKSAYRKVCVENLNNNII